MTFLIFFLALQAGSQSHYTVKAGLELLIVPLPPPECRYYRHAPPRLAERRAAVQKRTSINSKPAHGKGLHGITQKDKVKTKVRGNHPHTRMLTCNRLTTSNAHKNVEQRELSCINISIVHNGTATLETDSFP